MSDVFFARAVLVQEVEGKCVRYSTDNESAIIITKSEDLNIVLPASENGPSIYLDIPLSEINHLAVATLDEPSQLSPTIEQTIVALSIQMSSIPKSSCYLNAVRCHTKSIEVAFDNLDAATRVKLSLAANKHSAHNEPQLSQSVIPIDVSQVEDDRMDDFALPNDNLQVLEQLEAATPKLDDLAPQLRRENTSVSQAVDWVNASETCPAEANASTVLQGPPEDLVATATESHALVPERTSLEEPQPTGSGAIHTQQLLLLGTEDFQEVKLNRSSPAARGQTISASRGILVNPEAALDAKEHGTARHLEYYSETELRSSEQWQKGKQLIDSAPEFKAMLPKTSTQQNAKENGHAQMDGTLSKQVGDPENLYRENPRASPTEPRPVEPSREHSSRRTQLKHPNKALGKLHTGAFRSNRSAHKKLTQRMRNDEGEVTAKSPATAAPLESLNRPRKAETPKLQTKEKLDRGILKSGGSHIEGREQSKRQGKQQRRTSKSSKNMEHTNGNMHEFEMPVSPLRSRKHRAAQQVFAEVSLTQSKAKKKETQSMHKEAFSAEVQPNTYRQSPARHTQAGSEPGPNSATASHGPRQKRQTKPEPSVAGIVNWDEDLEVNEEKSKNASRKVKRKAARTKPLSAGKGQKQASAKPNPVTKRGTNGKASPVSLNKPRTRRAAAVRASKKIQGIAESDVSEKECLPETQLSKRKVNSYSIRKEETSSMSPKPHRKLGDASQKVAPLNTQCTSSNDQHNRVDPMQNTQRQETELPAPQADPKTSLSDENFRFNAGEQKKSAVHVQQDTSRQDNLGIVGTILKDGAVATDNAPALIHENINPGDLDILEAEDSHFQDAMAFSAGNGSSGSKSPISGDKRRNSAIDSTKREDRASELSMENSPDQNSQRTKKMVELAAPTGGDSWAGKLKGALSTVPICSPQSTRKPGRKTKLQEYLNTPRPTSSKVSSRAVVFRKSPTVFPQISSPHHLADQQWERELSDKVVEADKVNLCIATGQSRGSTRDKSRVLDVPPAGPVVEPASKASTTQLSEVIEISSEGEASLDENFVGDSEVATDEKSAPASEAAHDAQTMAVTPLSVSSKFPKVPATRMREVTMPQSTAKSRSEQPRRKETLSMETGFSKTIINTSPKTVPEGNEPLEYTPDPNRRSNLISFGAIGPRNQGVASGQKPSAFESTECRDLRLPLLKEPNNQLRAENQDIGEAPPREPTPVDTNVTVSTGGRQAQETAPSHGELRVSKLVLELQNPEPTTKRRLIFSSSSSQKSRSYGIESEDHDTIAAESEIIVHGKVPLVISAKPLAAVADMGYNAGKAKIQDNGSTRKTSHAVPVRLPYAEAIPRTSRRSLSGSRIVDASQRKPKRYAADNGVDVLNEVALGKRRKLSPKVTITEPIPLRSILRRSSSIERDVLQIAGSQSSRVNENGSPLPFTHSRHTNKGEFQRLTQNVVRLPTTAGHAQGKNEGITRTIGRIKIDDSTAPLRRDSRAPRSKRIPLKASSNNKLQASSPNAPSSIVDEMEPHHIDDMGKFINMETDKVITSHAPPDPFMGTSQERPNKFIEALRRSSDGIYKIKTQDQRAPNTRSVAYGDIENEGEEGDMEKTLIEPDPQNEDADTASESNSRSSESENRSPPEKRSGRDSYSTVEDEWRDALQPHQRQTLDVLYDISHVSPPIINILHYIILSLTLASRPSSRLEGDRSSRPHRRLQARR